jgi:hypothetical protein
MAPNSHGVIAAQPALAADLLRFAPRAADVER